MNEFHRGLGAARRGSTADQSNKPHDGSKERPVPRELEEAPDPPRIYRRWLFDACRLDIVLPKGTSLTAPCRRSWVMTVIDEETGAISAATPVSIGNGGVS